MRDAAAPPITAIHPHEAMQDRFDQTTLSLRIMATTDIHMQLLGYDYLRDCSLPHNGLAGLATLVDQARAEARAADTATLLFDNGDFLQGTALGETLSRSAVGPEHPVLGCINHMSYDALGVGNHDLDHGFPYLLDLAAVSPSPMISTNLRPLRSSALQAAALITCACPQQGAAPLSLRIGVLSVMPDLTAQWHQHTLEGNAVVTPAQAKLRTALADLRAQGTDLVILLAHMGIEHPAIDETGVDDVRSLAAIAGIDVVIAGHTHRRLPGQDHGGFAQVDNINSTIATRPAVMAGYDASDLAVLDLGLSQDANGRWRVLTHTSELRRNTHDIAPHPAITAICSTAHHASRTRLARPVGQTGRTLHNFFSLGAPTLSCTAVAQAKHHIATKAIRGFPEAELPLLASASAHTAGGFGGPENFLFIPQGPVLRRHLKGLDPYANKICALRINGAELRGWLEYSARVFHRLSPNTPDQLLVDPARPSFEFDTIYGVQYCIDPTRVAGARLVSLTYNGDPVSNTQQFVMATSEFQTTGGVGRAPFAKDRVLAKSRNRLATALGNILTRPPEGIQQDASPWRFSCPEPVQAVICTTPQAMPYLKDIAHLSPQPLGLDGDGFLRIRLTL
ncbi:5'-nucleotidase C-terminal domain-containing protein [Sulfitobacter geojensis]|uniref:5'-nucleotidase C-terminal domain-containing protein n=1 Tax=Sulfitobacter geojensis TaxID=1342299 RepID=UPI00046AA387|nr:5'-nucleotidase C-terminal domain-containing protein [Sulfitobacter geojensis]KHA50933.1 2',3'-cyclic-nucleotide 2'-phosphodiesterase [Sulfitobacter geojensis]NYI26695.1 2',3'-cyclic-nucleotide 2'-phosphodiesterase/3'-nucleotidase [Sulfitobacter geojensis]